MKYVDEASIPQLSDDEFLAERARTRPYTLCILKAGPEFEMPDPTRPTETFAIIMRHGKRNVAMHKAGLLPVVCPVADGGEVVGIGVFDASAEDVHRIMSDDPAVKAQVLTYELHPTSSFPLTS